MKKVITLAMIEKAVDVSIGTAEAQADCQFPYGIDTSRVEKLAADIGLTRNELWEAMQSSWNCDYHSEAEYILRVTIPRKYPVKDDDEFGSKALERAEESIATGQIEIEVGCSLF